MLRRRKPVGPAATSAHRQKGGKSEGRRAREKKKADSKRSLHVLLMALPACLLACLWEDLLACLLLMVCMHMYVHTRARTTHIPCRPHGGHVCTHVRVRACVCVCVYVRTLRIHTQVRTPGRRAGGLAVGLWLHGAAGQVRQ